MKPLKLPVAFYLVLVFLSGVLVGGLAHRFYTLRTVRAQPGPRTAEEYRQKYVEEMRTRLKLSPEQVTQLNAIMDSTRARYREMRERTKPEMKAIHEEQVQRVRAILDEAQKVEYEKIREEREQRRREWQKRHH